VRPLPGPFTPDPEELARMVAEVAEATALGVHGVVLGALTAAREIDREALARLLDAADGLPMTFHRAFDRTAEPRRAWEDLRELGIDRVLTSGGARTAWEGRGLLRELVAAGGPTVLAGGGVRGAHAEELVAETGVTEVHARGAAVPALREALAG
jgi:copper homeostasis protein